MNAVCAMMGDNNTLNNMKSICRPAVAQYLLDPLGALSTETSPVGILNSCCTLNIVSQNVLVYYIHYIWNSNQSYLTS